MVQLAKEKSQTGRSPTWCLRLDSSWLAKGIGWREGKDCWNQVEEWSTHERVWRPKALLQTPWYRSGSVSVLAEVVVEEERGQLSRKESGFNLGLWRAINLAHEWQLAGQVDVHELGLRIWVSFRLVARLQRLKNNNRQCDKNVPRCTLIYRHYKRTKLIML